MKLPVLYQGTASAVPERDEPDGLQPLGSGQGLKPSESALSAARLKPCPDTRRPTSEFGKRMRAGAILFLAAATLLAQPPEIRTGGVVNAASRTPSILPGGAIARGALFDIEGIRLGTSAQTTSVTVSARGSSLRVPLFAVSPQRIEGRLPVGAPLGDVALTVTVNGVPGPPYALKVVRANFGIFSRSQKGWGPGRVENQAADGSRSGNGLRNSAQPGQPLILSGTGLGPSRPEVWVGFRRATVDAVRRGTGDGADEIVFRLPPDSPAGCYVPLQVRQPDAAPSNTVTVSIHAGGGACQPPPILPMAAWEGHSSGLVVISRTLRAPDSTITDEGLAVFVAHADQGPTLHPILLIPPLGTCTAYTGAMAAGAQPSASAADALMSSPHAAGRDAGPRLTVTRGNRRVLISPVHGAPGVYKRVLGEQRGERPGRGGPLFLEPGNLVVAGPGGADIGAFAFQIPAPEPFVWENRDTIGAVDRRLGVTLRWLPLHEEGVMLIGLMSVDSSSAAWGACYCAAAGASGSFTIPPAMLANLPASQPAPTVPAPSLWVSYEPFHNQQPLHVSGLDNGLAISLFMQTLEVQVR
jgi:uncharacterized protein (TIGR03437 family)